MRGLSLTARLGLLFAACTAAVSLTAGVLFSRASQAHFVELDQQLLESRLAAFRALVREADSPASLAPRLEALQAELRLHPDLALRLRDLVALAGWALSLVFGALVVLSPFPLVLVRPCAWL